MKILNNILEAIGNTPIVKLQKIVPEGSGEVYVKLEANNQYNITSGSFYYHYFEGGLKSDSYSFTVYAEDSEGNSNSKKISVSIG